MPEMTGNPLQPLVGDPWGPGPLGQAVGRKSQAHTSIQIMNRSVLLINKKIIGTNMRKNVAILWQFLW